jgi:hypothetical protein
VADPRNALTRRNLAGLRRQGFEGARGRGSRIDAPTKVFSEQHDRPIMVR